MHGMDVFMLKNCTTSAPDSRKQPYVYEWSLIFFHKLLFGDIKLSDLERDVGTESCLPMTALIISKLYFRPITTTKHVVLIVAVVEVLLREDSFPF